MFIPVLCCATVISPRPRGSQGSNTYSVQVSAFERKLETKVDRFDAAGRTLVANLLDLAYEYELPIGLEYLDRDAVTRPITLQLRDDSVRGLLVALVQQDPEYRVSFSDGLVDIYSPKARDDPSNLLNKPIKEFAVTDMDTHRADMELLCELAREAVPAGGCGGSIAVGQWGPLRITVHLHNSKVHEILNAIVAQNGKAAWTVMTPPNKLSKIPFGGLWHIYPLEAF